MPSSESKPRVCRTWQQLTGDAGWGGVLAETAAGPSSRQAVLVFQPGMDMLPLLAESLALLPAELRWRVSFSTYFTKLPPGSNANGDAWSMGRRRPSRLNARDKPAW